MTSYHLANPHSQTMDRINQGLIGGFELTVMIADQSEAELLSESQVFGFECFHG